MKSLLNHDFKQVQYLSKSSSCFLNGIFMFDNVFQCVEV